MFFTQYYLEYRSRASYMIGDEVTGQVVVVDPRRDVGEYLVDARARGLSIVGVVTTHFHADFLAGHLELAEATGAWIRTPADGERIVLGDVVLQVLETPGHTPGSIGIAVFEHAADEVPYGVLTGDGLLVGDVGRPDLPASPGARADEPAGLLHRSIRSAAPSSVDDAILDRRLHPDLGAAAVPVPLGVDDVLAHQRAGAVVLDTRDPGDFAARHLAGSVNVPTDGRFAETAGVVAAPEQQVVVVAAQDGEEGVVRTLARIGFDHVVGYLSEPEGALLGVPGRVVRARRLTARRLAAAMGRPYPPVVIDVRDAGELAGGAIFRARHIPLAELPRRLSEIPPGRPLVVYCAGGYQSSVAASLLRREGWTDVSDLLGGYAAWAAVLPAR